MSSWPDGRRCAVTFTFHFDAETLWTSRDPANRFRPGVLSQGAYGARVGVDAILAFLESEQLASTFFVPGAVAERYPAQVRRIVEAGHALGHHGYAHERLDPGDDPGDEERILRKGLDALRDVAGIVPKGYCAPGWEPTGSTLDLLTRYGFEYATNLMDDIRPYVHPGTDIVELPVHWLLDDAPFRLFGSANPRTLFSTQHLFDIWLEEFRGIHEAGGLFNLTLHPQVSGRPSMLAMLRRLFAEIRSLPDVWVATCEELSDYWRQTPDA